MKGLSKAATLESPSLLCGYSLPHSHQRNVNRERAGDVMAELVFLTGTAGAGGFLLVIHDEEADGVIGAGVTGLHLVSAFTDARDAVVKDAGATGSALEIVTVNVERDHLFFSCV